MCLYKNMLNCNYIIQKLEFFSFVIVTVLVQLSGCAYNTYNSKQYDLVDDPGVKSIEVITKEGVKVSGFDMGWVRPTVSGDTLYAQIDGQPFKIAIDEVEIWIVEVLDTRKTTQRAIMALCGVGTGLYFLIFRRWG